MCRLLSGMLVLRCPAAAQCLPRCCPPRFPLQLLAWCDRYWVPLEFCQVPGAFHTRLPFVAPMDHILGARPGGSWAVAMEARLGRGSVIDARAGSIQPLQLPLFHQHKPSLLRWCSFCCAEPYNFDDLAIGDKAAIQFREYSFLMNERTPKSLQVRHAAGCLCSWPVAAIVGAAVFLSGCPGA